MFIIFINISENETLGISQAWDSFTTCLTLRFGVFDYVQQKCSYFQKFCAFAPCILRHIENHSSNNTFNFADDNTLTAFANSIQNLIHLLESESSVAMKWFKENKMIVDPGKFQAIILNKKKTNHTKKQ